MKIYVSITDSSGKKTTFSLREKPIVIGRSQKAHVTINDELASSAHCHIYYKDKCVFVEDVKSKNGIFLNEVKVFKQRIYLGDKVRIGSSFLQFEPKRLDEQATKLLTSKGQGNAIAREPTLTLEKSSRSFDRKETINDKLYEGVQENKEVLSQSAFSKKFLIIREYLATLIDYLLALTMIALPGYVFFHFFNEEFIKVFYLDGKLNLNGLKSQVSLIIAGSSLILAFIFHKINRKKLSSSIGERLLFL